MMVVDEDQKSNWFMVALIVVVAADFIIFVTLGDVPRITLLIVSAVEVISIASIILAGRWYTSAHAEREQSAAMSLILNQLDRDEINHILFELQKLPLKRLQKRLIERLIAEHCHQTVKL